MFSVLLQPGDKRDEFEGRSVKTRKVVEGFSPALEFS